MIWLDSCLLGIKVNLKDLSSKKIHLFWATGQDFFEL